MNEKDFRELEQVSDILCVVDADAPEGLPVELENITTDDILCVDDTDAPEGPKHSKYYDAEDIDCVDE